ncbi:MAG: hypothetical protein WCG26_08550 [Chloroflexales bacterium]
MLGFRFQAQYSTMFTTKRTKVACRGAEAPGAMQAAQAAFATP